MGDYLNTTAFRDAYLKVYNSPYFVDKSQLLGELIHNVDTTTNCVCITRPRRFGKSVAANMIASFFSKECDMEAVFGRLKIAANASSRDYDALKQIRDKKYAMKFEGKLGEAPKYTGRVLGVGMAYDKETKVHSCKVEVLREAPGENCMAKRGMEEFCYAVQKTANECTREYMKERK